MDKFERDLKQEQAEMELTETWAVHVNEAGGRPRRTVTFGSVTVTGPEPTPEQRARNSAESEAALRRLASGLAIPGVVIERKPGVPLIYANKYQSGTVIRELDGRKEVGTLAKDGIFTPLGTASAS
ncbi:hypothetical protein QWZ14_11475 [Paeniroseomonas aquatica]|uniref:TNase-like domain-containing protein n=1 Tax=Paeniroseomonas aquatica TaxID=373043 RepID=A0ABT8A5P6_9PROT|nr:hypothetical protein [Paeniroseomonas aquatica]MDN3564980.1 hypothetical protein [Paeniroseomonas aquatica]